MYDAHIVIPSSLRARFFEALHDRRQSTVKSRAKTREAMWWPKIRVDIEDYITACATWANWRTSKIELIVLSPLPELLWQKVAVDLFELGGKHCLLMIDYYSRHIELIELRSETADIVINAI